MTPLGILAGFAAVLAGIGIVAYLVIVFNSLIQLRNETKRAWANVDVLLKQRADEVPNLVAVVTAYAAHERALLEELTAARTATTAAHTRGERVGAERAVERTIGRALAVAEAYPSLRADASFRGLQQRLSHLEDLIADRRELYNDSVTALHDRIASFPDLLVAHATRQAAREALFEATPEDGEARAAA